MRNAILVVPIDYGSNADSSGLSDASQRALEDAGAFVNKHQADDTMLACCNADFPHLGMRIDDSVRWKNQVLGKVLINPTRRVMVPGTNSITEARNIRDALERDGIWPHTVVVFCDRFHAMRLRVIWAHFFPESTIEFKTARYVVGSDYAQILLCRELTWGFANIAGLIAMKIFGVERLASIKEP